MVRVMLCNNNLIRNIEAGESKAVRLVKNSETGTTQPIGINWYHTTYGP